MLPLGSSNCLITTPIDLALAATEERGSGNHCHVFKGSSTLLIHQRLLDLTQSFRLISPTHRALKKPFVRTRNN